MTEQDERLAWRSPGGRLTDPVGAATVTFRSGSRRHQVHSHPGAVAPPADDTPEGHDLCRRSHTDVGTRRRATRRPAPAKAKRTSFRATQYSDTKSLRQRTRAVSASERCGRTRASRVRSTARPSAVSRTTFRPSVEL